MSFKISDKELLKKYDQICKRIEKLLKIEFDSKPVYGDNEKCIKIKIKTYGDSVITNFHTVIVLLQIFIIKKFQKKKHRASFYQ